MNIDQRKSEIDNCWNNYKSTHTSEGLTNLTDDYDEFIGNWNIYSKLKIAIDNLPADKITKASSNLLKWEDKCNKGLNNFSSRLGIGLKPTVQSKALDKWARPGAPSPRPPRGNY